MTSKKYDLKEMSSEKLKLDEAHKILTEDFDFNFPTYTKTLINRANEMSQACRKQYVGQMSEIALEHKDKTFKEWEEWYFETYPDAIDKIRMREPSKYKTIMYSQLCEMIDQDLISFTAEYDYHGYLTMLSEENGEVIEKNYTLSLEEEIGLKQLDALKEEVTHMYKYKSSNGNIRYDLAPGFENILHDDRSYCLALMGHALFELRSQDTVRQKRPKEDTQNLVNLLPIKQGYRNR